jgi:hypothetical protein
MKMKYVVLLVVMVIFMVGCASILGPLIGMGRVEEDQLSEEYVQSEFGEHVYMAAQILPERDFNIHHTNLRDGIIYNTSMTDEERQDALNILEEYTFEFKRYVAFYIRVMNEPAMIKQTDFNFTFNDQNGNTFIDTVLNYSYRERVSGEWVTGTYYHYVWMLKLKHPINTEFVEKGDYLFEVEFPNGEKIIYKFST